MTAGTGSRGAALSLAGGMALYFIFLKNRFSKINPAIIFFSLLIATIVSYYIFTSELLTSRFSTINDDERIMKIWPAGIAVFKEYVLFGAGAARFEIEMIRKVHYFKDLHNEYLTVLTRTGLVGLFFFLLFFKRIYSVTNEWRKRFNQPLRITLLLILLIYLFKAGGSLFLEYTWITLIILSVPPRGYFKSFNI
jgi:O-antigen ligase